MRSAWLIIAVWGMMLSPGLTGCGGEPAADEPQDGPQTHSAQDVAGGQPVSAKPAHDDREQAPAAPKTAPAKQARADDDAQEPKEVVQMAELTVKSSAFEHEGPIPREYTCDGADVSPPLSWDDGPAGTQCYALIMDDPDAPSPQPWVHWVAWNIPGPALVDVIPKQATMDDGMMQGMNSWPKVGYGGPCPPSGTHRYYFKVYALDTDLDLGSATTKEMLLAAMANHILAQGELMGTYQRQR